MPKIVDKMLNLCYDYFITAKEIRMTPDNLLSFFRDLTTSDLANVASENIVPWKGRVS